jgi:hypothetical protein
MQWQKFKFDIYRLLLNDKHNLHYLEKKKFLGSLGKVKRYQMLLIDIDS